MPLIVCDDRVLVGFSTSNSWISRVIRWFTKAKCSHTFLIYRSADSGGTTMVLEAANVGFRQIPLWHWYGLGNNLVAAFSVEMDLRPSLEWALADLLGDGYNWEGLFGMAVVILGRWLKKKWSNLGGAAKSNFCSEANAKVLRRAGVPGFDLDPPTTSPQDLYEWLVNHEGAIDQAQIP